MKMSTKRSIKKNQITTSSKRKKMSTSRSVKTIVQALQNQYKQHANAIKARQMKKYMRDQFEYFGINAPDRRNIDKAISKTMPDLTLDEHHQIMQQLWDMPQREFQHFAAEFSAASVKVLMGDSEEEFRKSIDCVQDMITKKSWWDCVDLLAPKVIGEFNKQNPEVMGPILDEWITNNNIWLKRSAILHQLFYKDLTDQDKLFRYCLACADEKDFFIRKAIGWALRNQFRVNPTAVKKFVKKNEDKLSTLSKKEALKHA